MYSSCRYVCIGGMEARGPPTGAQSAPRARRLLSAPIDFYYKNSARGFFLFSAHRKPGNAHKEIRIIRLQHRLTNAIDFYNEATNASLRRQETGYFILFRLFIFNENAGTRASCKLCNGHVLNTQVSYKLLTSFNLINRQKVLNSRCMYISRHFVQ